MSRLIVTLGAATALLITGLTLVGGADASAATSTLVTSVTLHVSNGATYAATSAPYTGSGSGSAWTVTVPQDSASSAGGANYTLSSVDVVMPQADVTTSPIAVVRVTGPGSAVPYGTLTYSGSANLWHLTSSTTQTLESAGTQVLQAPVTDTGGSSTVVQLSLVVAPLVSSMTMRMGNGALYDAVPIAYTGMGNGSHWSATVHLDSAMTPGSVYYDLSSVDVVMPQADVTTSPIAVVRVTGPGSAVPYGTLTHASATTWILTPSSTQSLQMAGTWVLQASVKDVGGATNTVQLTIISDPRPSILTGPVTNVTTTSATVNGTVANFGTDVVTGMRFCYSTTVAGAEQCAVSVVATRTLPSTSSTIPYRSTLYRLRAGTTYYVVFEAIDSTTGARLLGRVESIRVSVALVLTSIHGTVGTPLALSTSGGVGTGVVSYFVTNPGSAGCVISRGVLNAARVGTCTVTAVKAADATYPSIRSSATTVTFTAPARRPQAALRLATTKGTVGTALVLSALGGSGTGAVSYGVTSAGTAGCWIAGGRLNASRVGTCTVTVYKAADATYLAASSPATAVAFKAAPVKFRARRVSGFVRTGEISTVTILGAGFYGKPRVRSNEAGTRAVVIHDRGDRLAVRVQLRAGSATGWHVFTVILANGHVSRVRYMVKAGPVKLRATRVDGYARVGRISTLTIIGSGFYARPSIISNVAGTRAVVIHDRGDELVVRVQSRLASPRGWHVFTIILANGRFCRVRYLVR